MKFEVKDLNAPSRWNMRIWDDDKKEWLCQSDKDALTYYGFDITGGETTEFQGLPKWHPDRHLIWEQSTGLIDKHGKEIYEGDIVNITALVNTDDSDMTCIIDTNSVVCWDKEHVRWDVNDKPEDEDWDYRRRRYFVFVDSEDRENVEVIGNIHENPELLGDKNVSR